MGTYRTALVCKNGHVVVSALETSPELASNFCAKCGAETISACDSYNVSIRGHYDVEGVISFRQTPAPSFCHACGKAHVWTAAKLESANALAEELEGLTKSEREELKAALPDLVAETPRTPVALVRVHKSVGKASGTALKAFRDIVVDIAAEAVKRQLWAA